MALHPLKVLIIEDQFLIASQIELIVKSTGHDVVGVAASREEAIRLAESARPELAFVDISLADGVSGVAIGKEMVDGYGAAVVFMTANARRIPDDFCGAVGVVEKPFSRNDLVQTLAYLEPHIGHDGDDGFGCGADAPPLKPRSLTLAPAFEARWAAAAAG